MIRRTRTSVDDVLHVRIGPNTAGELERVAAFLREHSGRRHRVRVVHAPRHESLVCSCKGGEAGPTAPAVPPGVADLVEEDLNDDDA